MRITQKGQVTIPENIRKKYGFSPHSEIDFKEEKGKIYIVLIKKKSQSAAIINRLRGSATVKMTTDEIMALTRGKQ